MLKRNIFVLDQNVTFSWIASGSSDASDGHNVNYIGHGPKNSPAGIKWENCNTTSVLTTPITPNYVHNMTETGWNYFFCGLPGHCINGTVKAKVLVVEKLSDLKTHCPMHSY